MWSPWRSSEVRSDIFSMRKFLASLNLLARLSYTTIHLFPINGVTNEGNIWTDLINTYTSRGVACRTKLSASNAPPPFEKTPRPHALLCTPTVANMAPSQLTGVADKTVDGARVTGLRPASSRLRATFPPVLRVVFDSSSMGPLHAPPLHARLPRPRPLPPRPECAPALGEVGTVKGLSREAELSSRLIQSDVWQSARRT